MIRELKDHHIVCGCGRVGMEVVLELKRNGEQILILDHKEEILKERAGVLGIPYLIGNAVEPGMLEAARIESAKSLSVCLPSDADNVYICLAAQSMCPDLYIVARGNNRGSEGYLKRAGAARVISPYTLSGHRIAQLCTRPVVTQFLDHGADSLKFEEIRIPERSSLAGCSLKDSGIRQKTNTMVVGILRPDGTMQANPGPDDSLGEGDTLVLLGSDEQLLRAEALLIPA